MMRTSLGLLFSALFVSAVFGTVVVPNTPIKLMPGQSYVYSYTGRLASGIVQLDNNAAVLEIKSDIVLQPEQDSSQVAMQMTNIRVGKYNGAVSEQLVGRVVIDHQTNAEYDQYLSKPIRFTWVDGQIKSFEAERDEPEWSINVKKSILALFNVNLKPQQIVGRAPQNKVNTIHRAPVENLVVYPVYEDGVNGICETLYELTHATDAWQQVDSELVLNVTKTRNYDNCLTEPTIENTNADVRGAPVMCRQGKTFPLIDGYYPMMDSQTQMGACPYGQSPKDSPVNSYNFVKYNISKLQGYTQIESIYGEGKTVFETKGKQILVIAQQELSLQRQIDSIHFGRIQPISNEAKLHQELSFRMPNAEESEQKYDIPYYHLFGKVNKQELTELAPELLNAIAEDISGSDISASKNTMQKVVQLANAFAVLDIQHFEQIFEQVAQVGRSSRASTHQQIVRKLFLDLIGSAGSTNAALFAKNLYEQDLITAFEAKEIFEAVPQNLFIVDLKVVEGYLNLFLSEKVQQNRHLASSLGICIGKMIHEASVKRQQTPGDIHDTETVIKARRAQGFVNSHDSIVNTEKIYSRIRRSAPWDEQFTQQLIEKNQITEVLRVLEKTLREASTFHQKVTLIETIAHMGIPEALNILAPYVNDQAPREELPGYPVESEQSFSQERNFIRQVTVYALTHVCRQYPREVLSLLLPVYQNQYEPYELRIAAFTVIINCDPGKQVLERIASELHSENNRQVKSFVISTLDTVANSTMPSLKKLAEDARFAVNMVPKIDLGMQYSKMVGKDFYDEDKKHGWNVLGEWVSSNVSQIPRAGYFSLRETNGPFQNVMLELGYNAKGMDSLIKRMLEPNGVVSDAFQALYSQNKDRRVLKRNADSAQQALQALKEKLNLVVRSEDEPKATIFMKLFERTSYYSLDRQFLHQIIDSAEDSIKDVAAQLLQGQSYHYVKLVMPNQLYKVVPSELGLPVVVTERHPTILSVKIDNAKLRMDMAQKAIMPTGANLTVQMQPALFHSTYQFVFAITPATNEAIGTHVEKTTRISVPLEFSVGYQRDQNQLSWSVVPKVPQEVFHHHTEAKTFISKTAIAGSPDHDWLEDAVEIKTKPVPFQYEKRFLHQLIGLGMRVQVTTEDAHYMEPLYQSKTAQQYGLLAALAELWRNDQITPCKVHLSLESDLQQQVFGYDFALQYKKIEESEKNADSDDSDESTESNESNSDESQEVDQQYVRNRQQQVWSRKYARQGDLDVQQVWNKIFNNKFQLKSIKKQCQEMMQLTKPVWQQHHKQQLQQGLEDELPAFVAHDWLFTAIARSPRPTFYAANFLLVKTFDERTYWLKVKAFAQNQQQDKLDHQLCMDSVISYPIIPSDFYYEPIANQDLKALIKARIGFGQDCKTGSNIQINGVLEKTDEKVITTRDLAFEQGRQTEEAQDWFYKQCSVDRAQGKPLSYACERAIIENSYFKQLVLDIQYKNLAPEITNLTRKLALATKVALYAHLDNNDMNVDNEQNKIRLTAQYSTRFADMPMANIYIDSPKENIHFEKIHMPYLRPVSALLSTAQVYKNLWTGYQSTDKCVLMENFVRTFDNVTVQLQDSACQYLVAKDCSSLEKFAVFARQIDSRSQTKEVTVLLAGTEIKLTPPTQTPQVMVDEQTVELTYHKPQVVANKDIVIYVRHTTFEATSPIVVVQHQKLGLTVLYDGKNVKVEVAPQYQGTTCGICGDNNNEAADEFTGPDGCLYQDAQDFINSYGLGGEHCEQAPITKGAKICPKTQTYERQIFKNKQHHHEYTRFSSQNVDLKKVQQPKLIEIQVSKEELARMRQAHTEHQIYRQPQRMVAQQQIQRLRTHAIQQRDNICFSVQPILHCIEGVSRPVQLRQEVVAYHCLPGSSISAQRLLQQAQYQVLEVFGKKSVDFSAYVPVPVACIAA